MGMRFHGGVGCIIMRGSFVMRFDCTIIIKYFMAKFDLVMIVALFIVEFDGMIMVGGFIFYHIILVELFVTKFD